MISQVAFYTAGLDSLFNITGDQLGAYFGYCLAVVDFNQDGRQDLVVGAPMFSDFADREMKIEVGRVYIIFQNEKVRFWIFPINLFILVLL